MPVVETPVPEGRHVPGETGVWVLILGDMLAFAAFFTAFLIAQDDERALFNASQEELVVGFGVVNTVLLLTSSLFVASSLRAQRAGSRAQAARLTLLAIACGLGFCASKALEWGLKLDDGITATDNLFWTYYYALTGIHLLHLLIGIVGLVVNWRIMARPVAKGSDRLVTEVSASYWHMVDVLWIILFPLLYLTR